MKLIRLACSFCIAISWFITATVGGQNTELQSPETTQDVVPSPDALAPPKQPSTTAMATGIVFSDLDGDGKFGPHDHPFVGVKVSNGVEIVKTDELGRYYLPLAADSVLFVIKPSGFRTAIDKLNLPRFFYIHKPDGSPKLKFHGSQPTGPLPQSIDFPLYQQSEPDLFRVILFGDPQPRNNQEVDYISHDVVTELVDNSSGSSFGVSLGDLAFDHLDTFETLNQTVALIGIPWYNVIGNHDINLDASVRKHINESYERVYGPSYYSFDYGQVHFVVLDNIDWEEPNERINQRHFGVGFGSEQLEFLKNDLAMIPESQMVVLMMHVPIIGAKDKQQVFDLIEKRPLCISISGHTHYHQHLFLGPADGFNGPNKHHHIVNVTVCGSWWSGLKDDRGIPHSAMSDGAPNGYSIMTFDGDRYRLDFKAAGRPATEQMGIRLNNEIASKKSGEAKVWVNVYNGSEKSIVEMSINDSAVWTTLQQKTVPDPNFVELYEKERKFNPPIEPGLTKPRDSSHLWMGTLPAELPAGTHLLRVRTKDMDGRIYQGHRSFRVTE